MLILVGIDDAGLGGELVDALERGGHNVTWVGALEAGPAGDRKIPDVVVVDGDTPNLDLAVMGASWKRLSPPPAMIVLAATAATRIAGERMHATVITKPFATELLATEVMRVGAAPRGSAPPTAAQALRVLGLASGGLPDDEAAAIAAGSRNVDLKVVREALRPHALEYVTPTARLDALCARRALTDLEARFATSIDGSVTTRKVIDSGRFEPTAAARLVWALTCGGAVVMTPEPPEDAAHPVARRVARTRDDLRARRARVTGASKYDVLEVDQDCSAVDVDRAVHMLAIRYAPERLADMDLGDLAPLVDPVWQQILKARATLVDARARQQYDAQRLQLEPDADERRIRRQRDASEAEAAFVRGQRALLAGDAFKAISELAAAARRLPDEPDYDVYCAWARVCAEQARGGAVAALAVREQAQAENTMAGRRPRPRALFALGLLCEAAGDFAAARGHLEDALHCDPRLTPAKQLLARLPKP